MTAQFGPGARIATIYPDGAVRDLGAVFNDDWMRSKGFLPAEV